ncbi:hypothetical protein IZ6_04020 [Terrihabitans soli]|uniref:Uncharacterized protein n=1 Tax=Terrihabitans soli TaxID=708113 RepID=A0A6S6QP32_9HYPH|nr:hypothetical protein [Terrihabitans soli]BCJ89667.1 hypothetical protein IZ6_04020 [Terrihabitans soli]
MQHIIMPPQHIIIGMPILFMFIICWQQAMNMSFMDASIGIISQTMPLSVILQETVHIIIGMGIGMPFIMPPMFIIGIIPPIMGMLIAAFVMTIAPRVSISGNAVAASRPGHR